MSIEHYLMDFKYVEKAFEKLIRNLRNDRYMMLYVKPRGLFDSRINAENIEGLSSYEALVDNNEHFGITKKEGNLIKQYFQFDDIYEYVKELHERFDMDSEHGSFMKIVNMHRRVLGATPMDKNGKLMNEDSEEYRRIFLVD